MPCFAGRGMFSRSSQSVQVSNKANLPDFSAACGTGARNRSAGRVCPTSGSQTILVTWLICGETRGSLLKHSHVFCVVDLYWRIRPPLRLWMGYMGQMGQITCGTTPHVDLPHRVYCIYSKITIFLSKNDDPLEFTSALFSDNSICYWDGIVS